MSTPVASIAALQDLIEQLRGREPPGVAVDGATRFVEDLGLASLELIGLVYLCEQTFQVDLVNQRGLLATLRTAGQTVDAIAGLQRAGTPERPVNAEPAVVRATG